MAKQKERLCRRCGRALPRGAKAGQRYHPKCNPYQIRKFKPAPRDTFPSKRAPVSRGGHDARYGRQPEIQIGEKASIPPTEKQDFDSGPWKGPGPCPECGVVRCNCSVNYHHYGNCSRR